MLTSDVTTYLAECDDKTSPECFGRRELTSTNDPTALADLTKQGWVCRTAYGSGIHYDLWCPACALAKDF